MGGYNGFAVCPKCRMNMDYYYYTGSNGHSYRCPICGFHASKIIYYEAGYGRNEKGVDLDGYVRSRYDGNGVVVLNTYNYQPKLEDGTSPYPKETTVLETWLKDGDIVVSINPYFDIDAMQSQEMFGFFDFHKLYKDENGDMWFVSNYPIDIDYGDESWVDKLMTVDNDYIVAKKIVDKNFRYSGLDFEDEKFRILDEEVRKIKNNRYEVSKKTGVPYEDPSELKNLYKHDKQIAFVAFDDAPSGDYKKPTIKDKFEDSRFLKRKVILVPWEEKM